MIILGAIVAGIGTGLYNMYTHNYLFNSPFVGVASMTAGVLVIAVIIYFIAQLIRNPKIFLWVVIFTSLGFACDRAKPNQQVLISKDCGVSWRKLDTADMIPASIAPCFIKIIVPNSSMQADSKFNANFANKVKVSVDIDSDYEIRDAISYIKTARYLGGMSKGADDSEGHNDAVFESLENRVIDKRIREAAKAVLLKNDVVEFDQGDLEDEILEEANKLTEKIGIHINFISLTLSMGSQTEQAIDAAVAMQIYASRGMEDVGKSLILAKAGATQVNVNTRVVAPKSED